MGVKTFSKARYWDSTEAASIHAAVGALADSIDAHLVGTFPDVTTRSAAAAPLISAGAKGLLTFIEGKAGFSYWDGLHWLPLGPRVLFSQDAGFSSVTPNTNPGVALTVITSGNLVLPAGNRLLMVVGNGWMTTDAPNDQHISGRAAIGGDWFQTRVDGDSVNAGAFSKQSFTIVKTGTFSGTVKFDLTFLKEPDGNPYSVYCTNPSMRVIDMGPADA